MKNMDKRHNEAHESKLNFPLFLFLFVTGGKLSIRRVKQYRTQVKELPRKTGNSRALL